MPEPEADWPVTVTDEIIRVVESVRDKTTGPIQRVAKGLVYGLFAAILGTAIAVLLAVAFVRVLVVYTPDWDDRDHVWVAHLLVGLVFCAGGGLAWRRRRPVEV